MSRYMVTGAQGFAGGYLVEQLADAGHEVIAAGRSDVDLMDREAAVEFIDGHGPDGIFHLAASHTSVGKSWEEPERTIDENLGTTLSVLAAARLVEPTPRTLFVSSSEVAGNVNEGQLTEEIEPNPQNPYALSKYLAEKSCELYAEQFGSPIIIVRAFNHIGPGQKQYAAFPSFAAQIAEIEAGAGEGVVRVGNLEAERDFLDVRDMMGAYMLLMEEGKIGDIYNAGSGNSVTVRSILDLMISMSPADVDVVVDPDRVRPNDTPVCRNASTKLRDLGWQPEIELTKTVSDILDEARARV